ncbi:uncharacterized protein BDV17DRAFT_267668 [Aspergillus undulatus]|uniref:uncharacterized protein n=1 Tax=Aspergillus undulatus TaxID=1810928 RepID=UPI003CCCA0E5
MRVTFHLLKQKPAAAATATEITKVTSLSSSSPSKSNPFPWLRTLKTKQLQHLAQRTGFPCSGTKAVILEGLERGLAEYRGLQVQVQNGTGGVKSSAKGKQKGKVIGKDEGEEIRILSIDMGIRNLAFAVLGVKGLDSDSDLTEAGFLNELVGPHSLLEDEKEKEKGKGRKGKGTSLELTLRAWRRVSLPMDRGFSSDEFTRYLDGPGPGPGPGLEAAEPSPRPSAEEEENALSESGGKGKGRKDKAKEKEKHTFSLQVYATHAHSMLTTLLARYNPTHVLIERQRFRSGGGSAVQEWSLRVGMFEGMLWAVLHSLRMLQHVQQGASASASASRPGQGQGQEPRVIAIEPSRVGRFWAPSTTTSSADPGANTDTVSGEETGTKKKKKKSTTSSREGKKLKIDLVGSWLENDTFSLSAGDGTQEWVDGYMAKWKKSSTSKSRSKSKSKSKSTLESKKKETDSAAPDITKIDDLADCLVQGITWLEWERTKGQVVRHVDGSEFRADLPS